MYDKIVLNVPHSSIERCYEGWKGCLNMFHVVKEWTDWHTDILFQDERATMVRFPFSRFFCDVERLVNDPLEKEGRGIIYYKFGGFERDVDEKLKLDILRWYEIHNSMLATPIVDNTMLIDCHSFPSTESNVDICIGVNDDETRPDEETIDKICTIFENEGYLVSINNPYSNSISPKSDKKYHSIMIEVNKRIYMNETTLNPIPDYFFLLKRTINKVYDYLLGKEEKEEKND